jgi:Restriction endonuclease
LNKLPDPKRIPEANEFSPGQVELKRVLELAAASKGDRDAIVEAIRAEYFSASASKRATEAERLKQQQTRANNVLIGLKAYGLFDLSTNLLTPVGESLLVTWDDSERADAFAAHILRERHGLDVLNAVRSLQRRGDGVSKASLQRELESQGFALPRATTHHTKVLQWLREAGVVDKNYVIDEGKVATLTGVPLESLEGWMSLTREQRSFATTLKRLSEGHGNVFLPARDVLTQAKAEHGAIFREDQLAARVFGPLESTGWLSRESSKKGRGGKSGTVAATEKLLELDLALLPTGDEWGIPAELRPKLDTPLERVLEDLASTDKHTKGIALELLALRMATDSGLAPLRFRLRAAETGQAEVDLIAEAVQLQFSRWLFQCKNTAIVHVHDLSKEVGMAVLLRAQVIVMVTTGRFTGTVKTYARELMEAENLQVILIDQDVLHRYRQGGLGALMEFLHAQAREAMRTKRRQIEASSVADD